MGLIGGQLVVDLVVEELLSVFSCVLYGQLIPRDVCRGPRRRLYYQHIQKTTPAATESLSGLPRPLTADD
jgi:hypothetical protein